MANTLSIRVTITDDSANTVLFNREEAFHKDTRLDEILKKMPGWQLAIDLFKETNL